MNTFYWFPKLPENSRVDIYLEEEEESDVDLLGFFDRMMQSQNHKYDNTSNQNECQRSKWLEILDLSTENETSNYSDSLQEDKEEDETTFLAKARVEEKETSQKAKFEKKAIVTHNKENSSTKNFWVGKDIFEPNLLKIKTKFDHKQLGSMTKKNLRQFIFCPSRDRF